jgi:hypothetical protein
MKIKEILDSDFLDLRRLKFLVVFLWFISPEIFSARFAFSLYQKDEVIDANRLMPRFFLSLRLLPLSKR